MTRLETFMLSPRRILVAVKDPRARSLPAVRKAVQLAKAYHAELELFHGIVDPISADPLTYVGGELSQLKARIRGEHVKGLSRIATRMRRQGLEVRVSAEWD